MADPYLIRVAGELADAALADQAASGDIKIVDQIGEILGASSQTLEEAFLTAVRVRRAEARARAMLEQRKANNYADGPKPKAAPLQGVNTPAEEEAASPDAPEPPAEPKAPSPNAPRRVSR